MTDIEKGLAKRAKRQLQKEIDRDINRGYEYLYLKEKEKNEIIKLKIKILLDKHNIMVKEELYNTLVIEKELQEIKELLEE